MFKKPGNSKERDPLANRLKAIASKPALAESDYVASAPKVDDRATRQPAFKQATLTLAGGERLDVVVKNISASGAKVQFFRNVMLTQKVLISEPTLRLRSWALVVWQHDGEAGLYFIEG
jgi:hypothetical protein